MVFEFRQYEPPQFRPQKLKRKQHAVSLPPKCTQISNTAENLNNIWPPQYAQETLDEITDKTSGSPDELPPIEELNTSAKPSVPSTSTSLDDITSSPSHVQADGNSEISSKSHDYAIIIDKDTNWDQNIKSSRPPQSLDITFLAPTNSCLNASVNIVKKDIYNKEPSAAEELLHAQIESDPAPIYDETANPPTDSSIEALYLAPATQISIKIASLQNSGTEARNEHASISPSAEDPPTPPVVDKISEDKWEAVEIIGEELINRKLYYTVEWKPTPVPEENCINIRELIKEWKKSKTHQQKGGKRTGSQTAQLAQEAGVFKKATKSHRQGKMSNNNKDSTKRPRGRPRKI
ncbi:unnamed protein product [Clonostachys rhizophaga]|uniref:Chromo domain-containing protein n=1 Tax=Clonostachys rhizophaga TaxID=160324 RepID=A0A9N9VGJ1_9HYPO|nr:unnamed protein product [Clonostachys rhizophaga]